MALSIHKCIQDVSMKSYISLNGVGKKFPDWLTEFYRAEYNDAFAVREGEGPGK